jgi:Na+/H+ antiporter NhaC
MEPGPLSLAPVLLAITVALTTRQVVPALFSGVFLGVLMLAGFHPLTAATSLVADYLVPQLTDPYNAGVLVLLAFIGGFVALMEQSGGAAALAALAVRVVSTRLRAQVAAWAGGVAIFFSDLGTPLIVGPIVEPLVDRLRVSREKLAWILDCTSSPVAVLVPITGWGVYIMSLLAREYEAGGTGADWAMLLQSLPFAFYPILTVAMVPVVALSGREFSRMARAEQRTRDGVVYWPGAKPLRPPAPVSVTGARPVLVWLPLAVFFVMLFVLLGPHGFPWQPVPGGTFRAALSVSYLSAAVVLIMLLVGLKARGIREAFGIYTDGLQRMTLVAVILLLAWTIGVVNRELGTAAYLVELTRDTVAPWLLPSTVFAAGAIVSFATGTSWGTYAIMLPLVVPMAQALGAPEPVTIGAVIAGGIFGDHVSPISDSTVLCATGAGCDLMDHVTTQLPYALLNATVSLVAFVAAGATASYLVVPAALVSAAAAFLAIANLRGVRIEEAISR